MSENQATTPVPLPPPLRLLTEREDIHVGNACVEQAQEYSVDYFVAQQLVYTSLAALGLFPLPGVVDLPDEYCHALKLAWDTTQDPDRRNLGNWTRCNGAPGHGNTGHHNYDVADWSDGEPGTVPDTRTT
ncbi:hypothetical protein ACFOY2_15260 [Nonomuraea purpurea]|uniref:Uncharacterized protein n=1 Tax=Nonomuraea purpurea TaxID=1849276 RepID=A0ABV8G7E3_9ACTN